MKIIKLFVGDVVEMKKNHPCGEKRFKVLRVGSDIKLSCEGCARTVTLERIKVEKTIKKIISSEENNG